MRHSTTVPALAVLVALGFAAPAAADGQALYEANCNKCHGPDGKAETSVGKAMKAASLVRDWAEAGGTEHIVKQVRENAKHKAVSGKLSDEDLQTIAEYIVASFGVGG